jgi:hypothetical protein
VYYLDKLDLLKDSISEELFTKEPLALAIILYLQKENKEAYSQIIHQFDEIVSVWLDKLVKKHNPDYVDEENEHIGNPSNE